MREIGKKEKMWKREKEKRFIYLSRFGINVCFHEFNLFS